MVFLAIGRFSWKVKQPAATAILAALALAGCAPAPKADYTPRIGPSAAMRVSGTEYLFGVAPLHNAVRLFETYQPLIDEINRRAGAFTIKLESARDYPSYEIKVRDRMLHFAMLNPHLVIPAQDRGYTIIGRAADKIRGLIVIRKDSNIRQIRDLRLASISFGARTDLSGTMMPKVFLKQLGLNVEKQARPKYVGSQESALMNVYLGYSAAACISAATWNAFRMAQPGVAQELQIAWQTDPLVGFGILARNDIPPEHIRTLTRILFDLNTSERGRGILEPIKVSSFKPASDGTYDGVWEFLNDYRRMFGRTPTLGGAE